MTSESVFQSVLDQVRLVNSSQRLFTRGDVVVAAVSGGADSLCLLESLFGLREELGIQLHVAHLDHMLRGEDAMSAADYVRRLSDARELPFHFARLDVEEYRRAHRLSVEEAAREVRYAFLDDVARQVNAASVATGHTADDQAETVLLHLVRGSGLGGLRGMRANGSIRLADGRQVHVVRPLLRVRRDQCVAVCRERELEPQIDLSNLEPWYTRNRIRLQLIPTLSQYNPRIVDAILRLSSAADDDLEFVETGVEAVWAAVAETRPSYVALRRSVMAGLPRALQCHVILRAVRHLLGDLRNIAAIHVEAVLSTLDKPSGTRVSLPKKLMFTIEYDRAIFGFEDDASCPLPALDGPHRLVVPGQLTMPGWRVRGSVHPPTQADAQAPGDRWIASLDADRVGRELTIRRRRAGDRFQPLGMGHLKRLQDFMVDAKIPRSWRSRVPVVESSQHIVWIAGWRIDDRVRVRSDTSSVLRLEMTPEVE